MTESLNSKIYFGNGLNAFFCFRIRKFYISGKRGIARFWSLGISGPETCEFSDAEDRGENFFGIAPSFPKFHLKFEAPSLKSQNDRRDLTNEFKEKSRGHEKSAAYQ